MRNLYSVGNIDPWAIVDPLSQSGPPNFIEPKHSNFDLRQTDNLKRLL
jgi:hypothetical protein